MLRQGRAALQLPGRGSLRLHVRSWRMEPGISAVDIQFQRLLAGEEHVDLVELLHEFAGDACPDLDRAACATELDRLGEEALLRAGARRSLRSRLTALSHFLYDEVGFHGNTDVHYDPRNSYLHEVLFRRTGIPISLAIVYLEVAAKAGIAMYGVGTPGHFVLGSQHAGETWYVDAFSGGTVLSPSACRARIEKLLDRPGALSESDFRPATCLEIAARVLRNLKAAYVVVDDWKQALLVQQRLTQLLAEVPSEQRDLGLMYLRLGHAQPGVRLLEHYAAQCSAQEREALAPYLRSGRRMLAELN